MRGRALRNCLPGLLIASAVAAGAWQALPPDRCAALARFELPRVTIERAAAAAAAPDITVGHCRVDGRIDGEIHFSVWLPDNWNHRFVMGGGGGFVGSVMNDALASVNAGFATAGTDTGHRGAEISAAWALNNDERKVNYAYAAVHATAGVAKAIVRAYYSADATHAYFEGCSNGGRQALMEAQRYPDDFDGVVAGAPAVDFTGLMTEFIRDTQAAYPDPHVTSTPAVTSDNLKLLESRVLAACDSLDGVTDRVMEDPRACRFDIDSIPACEADRAGAECFTTAQRKAIRTLYSPLRIGGAMIRPGQPFGGEAEDGGWRYWKTGPFEETARAGNPNLRAAFGTEFFKYFVFGDPHWDYSHYRVSAAPKDTAAIAPLLNATGADLRAFRDRGHKVILWHGWADPGINPLGSIQYYERVRATDPGVDRYFRMFMLPGVLHCEGGAGPDRADWLTPLVNWVEKGEPPERIIASKAAGGRTVRTRPLCAYPQVAVYAGRGSTDDAASFTCRASNRR